MAVLGAATAAFALVATVDPNQPGHYPSCPVLRHTGLLCPGCGGLRALRALTHGDLPAAWSANALVLLGCAAGALLWLRWCVAAARPAVTDRRPPPGRVGWRGAGPPGHGRAGWLAAGLLLTAVFSVIRNLPCGGFLAP